MKIIGITGGIGSGKTTICKVFKTLGTPVFHADDEARSLYSEDNGLISEIKTHFGEMVFTNNQLDKSKLASIVFSDKNKLQLLNRLVHPLTAIKFAEWLKSQTAPYVIREAAILIESGTYKDCDFIVQVTAKTEIKIKRVMARSSMYEQQVLDRMSHQMTDEQRKPYCQFEICNNDDQLVLPQIMKLHNIFKV